MPPNAGKREALCILLPELLPMAIAAHLLLTWPASAAGKHTASWLSIVRSTTSASQPYTYFNSSQLVEIFLAWMMRKNLLKLIGICKKLMILQFFRQPSFACWYFYQNRQAKCFCRHVCIYTWLLTQWDCSTGRPHLYLHFNTKTINILPQEWLWLCLWLLWGYLAGRHPLTGQQLTFWEDDTLDLHHSKWSSSHITTTIMMLLLLD